jgi:hypothetical protein
MMPGETGDSVMKELQQVVDALLQDENELRVEMNVRSGLLKLFNARVHKGLYELPLKQQEGNQKGGD